MGQLFGGLAGLIFVSIPIVWIVMHYRSSNRSAGGLSGEESQQLDELLRVTDNMAERIKTLESILDTDYPDWRERHDKE
jgi:phage shock protein B